jgi:high affinity Mn2+ porin
VEADIAFPNFLETDDVVSTRVTAQSRITERVDFMSTLRGRFGYAWDRWMIYGTGGLALSQARLTESPGAFGNEDSLRRLRTGWSLGAGAEIAIAPEWTARVEYTYDRFSGISAAFASGARFESALDGQMLRIGLNRRLDLPDTPSSKISDMRAAALGDWNIHGQATFVQQGYPSFRSPYAGANSLQGEHQTNNTISATAFVGWRPLAGTEVYINPELMQGFGLSEVHGVAAFPNGEAQKSNFPAPRANVARLFVRQTIGLGGEQETVEDGPNQLAGKQDISRITFIAGKLAVTDFFDGNSYGHDPRTSFLNWNMYCCGSYDWTMDKVGYTWGGPCRAEPEILGHPWRLLPRARGLE